MASAVVPAGGRMHQSRGDRHMFSTSDDNAMMKQIQATHAPDGREVDAKPLIYVIEDIMHRASPPIPGLNLPQPTQAQQDALDDNTLQGDLNDMLDILAYPINRISCEISCKCSGGSDAHTTTLALFNTLSSYSWDGKVVIALAAFAVTYGEFWLVAQLYPSNPLAKSVALLKQLPDMLEGADTLKPKFEALVNLIKAMLDVTKCIVEFKELPSQYINPDTPEMVTATAHTPTAVYWTIRSIVACASQITNLIGMGHEYIAFTTEVWELSSLAHEVSKIHSHLQKQLALCYQHIDEKRYIEAFMMLVRLFEATHIDNLKILKALIYAKDDQLPLVDGATKKRVGVDVLRKKHVLLLISDLDLSYEEHFILDQMYTESRQHPTRAESQYEVVWLPVVDRTSPWNDSKQQNFKSIQDSMPWYSLFHPSMLDPAVIKYIKEVWHFIKKPLLVVLDQQGKVVNPNAIHMLWIWGSLAFPFTSMKEEALWKETTWSIELLADSIDQSLVNWIVGGKFICLYGGEDLDWIRRFTKTAQAFAIEANIQLEMLYVGKSNPREKVQKNSNAIVAEKLSHVLPDPTFVWFFWVRLESMWHSKMQHGKSVENDSIMQEIMTVLSFDGSDQGWAVISRGTAEMAKAKGDTILTSLNNFETWKDHAGEVGFVNALNDNLQELYTPHHCNRLILPGTTGSIPKKVVCAECGCPMEKFIMFRCCIDTTRKDILGLSELKNKVVILLFSRPELLPKELLLLLVQQMFDHPHRSKLQGSYEIVWVPIPSSDTWTYVEEQSFDFLSNSLPWFSIRRPWLLSSIVVKFIKQAWDFKEKPLMVVLDAQGMVTNSNAIDMVLIWGAMAYPFSTSRENELWAEGTWNLQLLLDRIDPLVAKWVEEDQNLCIYGSDNIDWIRKFFAKMRNITSAGLQLKMVYVGKKNPSEHIRNILATMYEEKLTNSLTFAKINFFWLRLESMRRSKLRLRQTDDQKDQILKQWLGLLDTDDDSENGWLLMGRGSSTDILKLQGRKIMECLDLFPVWGENVAMLGLVGAIRAAIEPPLLAEPCHHSNIIPFVEGLKETVICDKCQRRLEKFVVYKCDVTE